MYRIKLWLRGLFGGKVKQPKREAINPYMEELSTRRLRMEELHRPQVVETPKADPAEGQTPKQIPLGERIRKVAIGDLRGFIDKIYATTREGKRKARQMRINKEKRDQFERLARGER